MIDPDTNPTQDTEHHLRGDGVPDAVVRGVAINVPAGAVAAHVYSGDGELLTKVLPAGGPLLPGHPDHKFPVWECSRCGMRSTRPRIEGCPYAHGLGCPMAGGAA